MLDAGRFVDAARFAERQTLARGGAHPFWLTQQAVALTRAGRCEEARAAAEQALAQAPDNTYALLAAADALRGGGRAEDALSRYEEAAQAPTARQRALRGVLDCLAALARWPEVLARLGEAPLTREQGARWRVKALMALDRDAEAADACREWLKREPNHPEPLWALTELDIRKEGLEPVLSRMRRLARIGSRPPIYREIYASLCRRAGRPGEAAAQYDKIAAGSGTFRIQRKKAFALAKSGQESEAAPLMEELLRQAPADVYLHSSYQAACRRMQALDRAERFYAELLTLHPEEKTLHGRLRGIRKRMERT